MGLHVISGGGNAAAIEYCRRVQPAAMKWLEPDRDAIEACRRASPHTKHIGRMYWRDQDLGRYGAFQSAVLSWAPNRGLDYVEGYNEYGGHGTSDREWDNFARLEVGLAKRLNDIGLGALIGGFSTGFLDEGKKVTAFRKAFEYMQAVGPDLCAFHAHEYAGPYMQYMVQTPDGLNQWDHEQRRFTGWSDDPRAWWDPRLEGWLTLRYRKLSKLLAQEGFDRVRMFVTESGIDDVNPRPGPPNMKGWRDYDGTEWSRIPGAGDFAEQMRWYMWQVSHDPFIAGVVDFGFATVDPQWRSFDLSLTPEMLRRVVEGQLTLPLGIGSSPTEPAPAPAPAPTPSPSPAPRPRVSPAVEVTARAAPGEGWAAFAARCAGHASTEVPWAVRVGWANEIKLANGLTEGAGLTAHRSYRMPPAWFGVEERVE